MPDLPNDPWISQHSPIAPEKLHALGYITFGWNACEYWTEALFSSVSGLPEPVAHAITHDMGDISIWNKIRDVAKARNFETSALDLLDHAAKLYDRCRSNRNHYVHAGGALRGGKRGLTLMRRKGPGLFGTPIPHSVEDMRRVAEDTRCLLLYLSELSLFLGRNTAAPPGSSPGKPPLPEAVWTPPPPDQRKSPRPPGPSRA